MTPFRAVLLVAAAALAAGCVIDPYADPLEGRDALVTLRAAPAPPVARVGWPVAYRRGARFAIENRTGKPVETLLLDLSRCMRPPRELTEIVVEAPAGAPGRILPAPRGTWPLRALVGTPGTVLLEDGARAVVVLRVLGEPGASELEVTVPAMTSR